MAEKFFLICCLNLFIINRVQWFFRPFYATLRTKLPCYRVAWFSASASFQQWSYEICLVRSSLVKSNLCKCFYFFTSYTVLLTVPLESDWGGGGGVMSRPSLKFGYLQKNHMGLLRDADETFSDKIPGRGIPSPLRAPGYSIFPMHKISPRGSEAQYTLYNI